MKKLLLGLSVALASFIFFCQHLLWRQKNILRFTL